MEQQVQIDWPTYQRLKQLGIIESKEVRGSNVGSSDYSSHLIQPWTIIQEYNLNYWDGDIIKRVLRNKRDTPREEDYEKIIHICKERLRQINENRNNTCNIVEGCS